jgi:predicted NAD/FAD-binding protein
VEALTAPFRSRIRLETPVTAVRRDADAAWVTPRGRTPERFDAVVMAVHSDQALQMLDDPSVAESEVLGAIRFGPSEAVLHTDRSLMPRARRAWAAWNYHVTPEATDRVTVTYDMNILQRLEAPETFLVTLNRSEAIDPARILGRWTYHHPIFSPEATAAQARHDEINGVNRTFYCGAYWLNGFHEDGVVSAVRAVAPLAGADETATVAPVPLPTGGAA